jgi:fructokinase
MPRQLYGAIEAGGTKFICAAGYGHDEIVEETRIPTTSAAETLGSVIDFFKRVERDTGLLRSFGVAAFGPIELHREAATFGQLLATPKPGWSGVSLIEGLRQYFARPVGIDTDVNAAALAETYFGAGVGSRSSVYVTVGTGIGGGAVIDGRTVRGLLHPEMGHLLVRRDARDAAFPGVCPFHGDCLEGLASGPAIVAHWGVGVDQWAEDHPGFEIIGAYLGQLAAAVALVLSAERIIFGGGVMRTGRLLPYIRHSASSVLNGYLPIAAVAGGFDEYIAAPALGERSGLAGAFILAAEAARHSSAA